ncbi:MAG: ThiF family adenylyltransferase, partial [Segetibacter sp.]|nr:ThiF family adenylyltransferase [Segetibacter sp.]
ASSDLAILKIHSHPGGYSQFSETDDFSDSEFFTSVFGWTASNAPHASAIMLPGGNIFGRFFYANGTNQPIGKIAVIGDVIDIQEQIRDIQHHAFSKRTIQAFGQKTYNLLNSLTIGVVGCSGTGSPTIEQLTRLGVKKMVLIDPDLVEHKNLNRILNTTTRDVEEKKYKVDVLSDAIHKMGLGTLTMCYKTNLYDHLQALKSLASCDVIFGCVDSVDGRHLLNQLCTYYLIPYFDLGVKLEADGTGGINKICGSVHYIQPGLSSLITRGVYTTEDLRASAQFRQNPDEYRELQKNSYIKNINVNSPAVISVNMQISSHGINEFLNRLHPFKAESCENYALSTIDLTENCIINVNEYSFETDNYLRKRVGRGDIAPFIEFSDIKI